MSEKQKSPWYWITGSDGKKSMSATLALVAFTASTAAYVLAIFEKIGSASIRPVDAAACAVYLAPALALYFGRRSTASKKIAVAEEKAPESNGEK